MVILAVGSEGVSPAVHGPCPEGAVALVGKAVARWESSVFKGDFLEYIKTDIAIYADIYRLLTMHAIKFRAHDFIPFVRILCYMLHLYLYQNPL